MCRHLAYVGEPVTIASVLLDPPHGLVTQAFAPRRQRHGTMNADGFGIGWYADGDPVPARYRRAGPIWADDNLPDLARVTRTRAMLCSVRSATPGTDPGAAAAAPYAHGRWLFSFNGALKGWAAAAGPGPGSAVASSGQDAAAEAVLRIAGRLPAADLLGLQARCDTALIWALVLARLRAGEPLGPALEGTLSDLRSAGAAGRFNLLLTDGQVIAATAAGDSLCYRSRPEGVIVASEPSDDDPDWADVPDQSVLVAAGRAVTIRSLLTTSVHTNGETPQP